MGGRMMPKKVKVYGVPAKGIATLRDLPVPIYSSPSEQFQPLQTIQRDGLYLPFLRRYPDVDGNWIEVTLLDGSKGWMQISDIDDGIQYADIYDPSLAPSFTSLDTAVITIDPGHGGTASGAVAADGFEEKTANLDIALKVMDLLTSQYNIKTIWMTRIYDEDVSLAYRADLGTASGGQLFISIHNNSNGSTSHGTETYYQCGKEQTLDTQQKSYITATAVQMGMLTAIQAAHDAGIYVALPSDRGVKCRLGSGREDYYYVLRNAYIPAILAECVFISNPVEGACLQNEGFRDYLAEGIKDGIIFYLNDLLTP
jgi:N-acetylmuramoyl-L-alanine amidase